MIATHSVSEFAGAILMRGTGVICSKCRSGIVVTAAKIAEEFSVQCAACHARRIYKRDELTAVEERSTAVR
jgi:DNA-directed RNA polymerase subunit RPC12/RpoP